MESTDGRLTLEHYKEIARLDRLVAQAERSWRAEIRRHAWPAAAEVSFPLHRDRVWSTTAPSPGCLLVPVGKAAPPEDIGNDRVRLGSVTITEEL